MCIRAHSHTRTYIAHTCISRAQGQSHLSSSALRRNVDHAADRETERLFVNHGNLAGARGSCVCVCKWRGGVCTQIVWLRIFQDMCAQIDLFLCTCRTVSQILPALPQNQKFVLRFVYLGYIYILKYVFKCVCVCVCVCV